MRRRFGSVLAVLGLLVGVLATAPTASAASIGACGGSGGTYRSGESVGISGGIGGVYGEAYANTPFGPCSPNDSNGINASGVQIALGQSAAWSTSFVTLGLIRCNHTNNSAWPASLCDGQLRAYAEQHGAAPWDYNMWNLGVATPGTAYALKIVYGCSGHAGQFCWYISGVFKMAFDMGSGLIPNGSVVYASWQLETHDPGDGLGNNVSGQSSGLGRIQYQKWSDKLWYLRSVGSACDFADAQHHCVVNGANGFYGYTTN